MANHEHLEILKQGGKVWNHWRKDHPEMGLQNNLPIVAERPDFSGADLRGVQLGYVDEIINLSFANFRGADLRKADLTVANLIGADLNFADLSEANLRDALLINAQLCNAKLCQSNLVGTDLSRAILTDADLTEANLNRATLFSGRLFKAQLSLASLSDTDMSDAFLQGAQLIGAHLNNANLTRANLVGADLNFANLNQAKLCHADLRQADLRHSSLIGTDLEAATLTDCKVFGTSIWNISLSEETIQSNLVITEEGEPTITVDNLEVAQFIYLLTKNHKVREVIDTITSKVVLILGSFSEERRAVLDAIREELRHRNFIPLLFDFDKPRSKDMTGTVETLARMARFIIADLTDPSSIPHELATLVPLLRTTPVLPLRLAGSGRYRMFEDLQGSYTWVLETQEYKDGPSLVSVLPEIIAPADKMADKFRSRS